MGPRAQRLAGTCHSSRGGKVLRYTVLTSEAQCGDYDESNLREPALESVRADKCARKRVPAAHVILVLTERIGVCVQTIAACCSDTFQRKSMGLGDILIKPPVPLTVRTSDAI
jgi:hypothetical protein